MVSPEQALSSIPDGLRTPLISEYNSIIQNYFERRWGPSELSGGRFSEIAYNILDGYSSGSYSTSPNKPNNFVSACRTLETRPNVPRSFQILIPRMLPALYEIRNNRNVGHVGGDVDSNHMDATLVLSMTSWIMAELVRVFHDLNINEAQRLVDSLTEIKTPLIWVNGSIKRVLNPNLSLKEHILLLLSSSSTDVPYEDLLKWTEYKSKPHFNRTLKTLHDRRLIEWYRENKIIKLLPPGKNAAIEIIKKVKQ